MKRARVLLGDDHSIIVHGIRTLLAEHYDVVGSADNGKSLVDSALHLLPDIVVLDVSMPVLNGIDAARLIKKDLPATKLVFLTMHASAMYLRRALASGASGYVLKSGAFQDLLAAIEAARKGESYVSSGFPRDVIESVRDWPGKYSRQVIELTDRQRQILQLIAEGMQNKEIADVLHVSVKTVEFHRARLMSKLGCHTVAELTRLAIEEGLISL